MSRPPRWLVYELSIGSFLIGLVVGWPATAADGWPGFHGPDDSGAASESRLSSTVSPSMQDWEIALPGRGLSGPIVTAGKVIVSSSGGPEQDRLHILCFTADSGQKLWERQFWATGRTMCHDKTSVAAPTPCTDGERVCVLFSSNDLVCLDLSGNVLWLRGITADYSNVSNSLGMASSPVIVDDVVVVQVENDSESYTVGVDLVAGTNRWRLTRPKAANWTSPLSLGNGLVGLQSKNGFDAIRVRDGAVLWQYDGGASTIPSSCRLGSVIYVPSHGVTALHYLANDDAQPRQLWRTSRLSPGTASPVVGEGRVFAISKGDVLTACSTDDGERLWQLRLKGPFSATPVIVGEHVICVNEDGLLQFVRASRDTGELVGSLDLGDQILASPAVAAGSIFLRSNTNLWKLRLE